jgi:hypothetical protein
MAMNSWTDGRCGALTAFAGLLLTLSAMGDAEPLKPVKGTHIILTPPSGFVEADRFPGFMSEETGSSVMVSELPAPYGEVTKGFNTSGFKKQGMILLSEEKASFGSYNGVLISAAQSARGLDFQKWMAVFGDDKITYLVTASFPKVVAEDLSDILKKTVADARVSPADTDPFDALTFRITPANDMKIAKVIGNGILLSKGGVFPAKSIETPVFVIGASASKELAVPNKKAFAEARLQKMPKLKDIRVKSNEPIKVGDLDGFESTAEALDVESNSRMTIYQVVLFDADGYYAMQGISAEEEGKVQLPTLKQIARSFRKTGTKTDPVE